MLGDDLPVLEDVKRGDAADPEATGRAGALIDIDLHHGGLAGVFRRDLINERGDLLAGSAPAGGEIDEDGDVGIENFLIEIEIIDRFDGVICHGSEPFYEPYEQREMRTLHSIKYD